MLTCNSEEILDLALSSVEWADEIIIIDDNSTDTTEEICRKYNAKFYPRKLDNFSNQRNYGLSKCKNEWVFILDSDEVVTPELREAIFAVLPTVPDSIQGFNILRHNYFMGRWIKGCRCHPNYILRLLRVKDAEFIGDVHEGMKKINHTILDFPIKHYWVTSIDKYWDKNNLYSTLGAQQMHNKGKKFSLFKLIFEPTYEFIRLYFLKKGIFDGIEGFTICYSSASYAFSKHIKLYYIEKAEKHKQK